jgi:tubulin polyglutamylase TTLL7
MKYMLKILIIFIIVLIIYILSNHSIINNVSSLESISKKNNLELFRAEIDNNLCNFQNAIKNTINEKNNINSTFLLNNKYYGAPCMYMKDDTFYTVIKELGFVPTNNILEAGLIVPCSYEATEKEVIELQNNNIISNKFGKNVKVFMLNNTDLMVSKWHLWEFLEKRYGEAFAKKLVAKSWNLMTDASYNEFVSIYDKNKLYITKNNNQRQEGLVIIDDINKINREKYVLIQELLQNPYLINGRKINLRIYCVVMRTEKDVKVYVYNDGFMYYTPEPFIKGSNDFKTNITTGYIDRKVYETNPLTHKDFKKYLDSNRPNNITNIEMQIRNKNIKLSTFIFNKINELVKIVLDTFVDKLGNMNLGHSFQLYGIDVAINENLDAMMMEINKGPDLSTKDEKDGAVKKQLIRDMLKITGLIKYSANDKPDFTLVHTVPVIL